MDTKVYQIVDSVDALHEALARVRAAQKVYATYTQEQVDKIFLAAATAADKARISLAKLAVEETGMGIVEDKVIKNHYAAEYIYNKYKETEEVPADLTGNREEAPVKPVLESAPTTEAPKPRATVKRRIPQEQIDKIVELTKEGWTVKDIAFDVGVSAPTVSKYQKEVCDVEE